MPVYNPLAPFQAAMIPHFLNNKVRYLVSQWYYRGEIPDSKKVPLLLTDYTDTNMVQMHHRNAKGMDKWAAIIDLENEKHVQKLTEMAEPESDYLVYVAFTDDKNKIDVKRNKQLVAACRYFIDTESGWVPKGSSTIKGMLELRMGELYMTFKYDRQERQVMLAKLEGMQMYHIKHPDKVEESYQLVFQGELNRK